MRLLILLFAIGIFLEILFSISLPEVLGNGGERGDMGDMGDRGNRILRWLVPPSPTPTSTPTPTPTSTPAFGRPVQISIPALNITTAVEDVGLDAQGNMGVTQNFFTVGFYTQGTRIGWQGNAVIVGHYDTNTGAPGIFYYLKNIPIGSDIYLVDEAGRIMTYRVYASESRPQGDWSLEEIFGVSSDRRLNLITCSGWWNPSIHNYSHRHIVFAKLVE